MFTLNIEGKHNEQRNICRKIANFIEYFTHLSFNSHCRVPKLQHFKIKYQQINTNSNRSYAKPNLYSIQCIIHTSFPNCKISPIHQLKFQSKTKNADLNDVKNTNDETKDQCQEMKPESDDKSFLLDMTVVFFWN